MTRSRNGTLALLALLFSAQAFAEAQVPQSLMVFAAASLTNVLDELGAAYQQSGARPVKFSYAASSTLAKQIEAGATADVFFSADTDWMDYLQSRALIKPASRTNLLGNTLVLIAPADSTVKLKIARGFGLVAALNGGRLSTGDPDSVPVGKYARAALTSLGVWTDVADKIVRADNVRTALTFVSRGEAPLGIVYGTDAQVERKVRVVDTFPDDSYPPIVYPVALTTSADPSASAFIAFLRGPTGQAAFKKYGFRVLP